MQSPRSLELPTVTARTEGHAELVAEGTPEGSSNFCTAQPSPSFRLLQPLERHPDPRTQLRFPLQLGRTLQAAFVAATAATGSAGAVSTTMLAHGDCAAAALYGAAGAARTAADASCGQRSAAPVDCDDSFCWLLWGNPLGGLRRIEGEDIK